jgi:ComF family protein
LLELIHRFKYGRKTHVGKMLGRFMADYSYPVFIPQDFTLIMPVPLHPARLRKRGFNQSVILARELSKKLSIPMDFMTLKRSVDTEPQVHLGKRERASNVKGAFAVSNSDKITGHKILLVDDVYTTGSTVNECARVLTTNGASSVAILTLARAI